MEQLLATLQIDTTHFLSLNQILYLCGIVLLAYIVEKIFEAVANFMLEKNLPILRNAPNDKLKLALRPFGKLLLVVLVFLSLKLLELNETQQASLERVLFIIFSLVAIWLGHKIVDLGTYYFTQQAERTDSKFDDIFIPLISKSAYLLVYVIGLVYVMHTLTIDVTGIIAGLGIGGLAFAFAAKDTIANLFGSLMLVLDRPFDIGDYIVAGSIEGTVVEVGFRSTRVRTFYDSIVTISNGNLMNQSIDNKGKRRYRRLVTTLGLEYDTPPEKIEAFCEGIRQLILEHKWTRKDNFHVYFTNFGASSLDVTMVVFWVTDDYAREQAEKHRLMIDILRLAKELDVSFAFPTQTVHVFNENKREIQNLDHYLDEAISRAKNVAAKPLSLKNPRSNVEDELQFGKNDIGL